VTTGPLPERGSRVDLTGLAGGSWTAIVERSGDGLIVLTAPEAGVPLPPPVRRLTMVYPARGIPWEVDVDLLAARPGAGAAERPARLTGEPHPSRRRAVRASVRVEVATSIDEGDEAAVLVAVTENISTAGALIAVAQAMPVGRALWLELGAGRARGLTLSGRVVRCDPQPGRRHPWRVAVAFDDLDPGDEDRLRRFLLDRGEPEGGGSG
jgi:hypothetical protein